MPQTLDLPTVALTMGDPAGVGPEVVLKALADPEVAPIANWIVVGDSNILDLASRVTGLPLSHARLHDSPALGSYEDFAFGKLDARCGAAAVEYVRIATMLCLDGGADAMVTAPLNKEAVTLSGRQFSGHTEYIAELCGATESRMLLASERLSTIHVTTHVALRRACELDHGAHPAHHRARRTGHAAARLRRSPASPSAASIRTPASTACSAARMRSVIGPAIQAAQRPGIECSGPHAGDTIFLQASRGAYDLVVAMYHDQGHIPMKLIDFEGTVNISLGIPIIRTSVDHGTAFDIAGKQSGRPAQHEAGHAHGRAHGSYAARRNLTMGNARWLDVLVIVAYMAALVSLGIRFSRRQTSTERYFVAKRSIPAWAMGLSLLATLISSVTFIAYPGSAYAGDWSNLVPGFMVVVTLVLTGLVDHPVFPPRGRRRARTNTSASASAIGARVYASIAFALGHFSKMGFVFYLLALTVSSMTGWKTDNVIILVGIITVVIRWWAASRP